MSETAVSGPMSAMWCTQTGQLGRRRDVRAYIAGIVAILLGPALLFFFPKKDQYEEMPAQYHAEEVSEPAKPPTPAAPALR